MKDISVEYAHIYTNNRVEDEHAKSLEVLRKLKSELSDSQISLVVLVDDYSFPDPTFNYDEFTTWLASEDMEPELVFRESQLIPACDTVLSYVQNEKLKTGIVDYIKAKKYPCSLFIAAWYLLRLGYIHPELFPEDKVAKRLINILPESFKPFEDQGIEIIRSTEFREAADNIEYRFFSGRLIA